MINKIRCYVPLIITTLHYVNFLEKQCFNLCPFSICFKPCLEVHSRMCHWQSTGTMKFWCHSSLHHLFFFFNHVALFDSSRCLPMKNLKSGLELLFIKGGGEIKPQPALAKPSTCKMKATVWSTDCTYLWFSRAGVVLLYTVWMVKGMRQWKKMNVKSDTKVNCMLYLQHFHTAALPSHQCWLSS